MSSMLWLFECRFCDLNFLNAGFVNSNATQLLLERVAQVTLANSVISGQTNLATDGPMSAGVGKMLEHRTNNRKYSI